MFNSSALFPWNVKRVVNVWCEKDKSVGYVILNTFPFMQKQSEPYDSAQDLSPSPPLSYLHKKNEPLCCTFASDCLYKKKIIPVHNLARSYDKVLSIHVWTDFATSLSTCNTCCFCVCWWCHELLFSLFILNVSLRHVDVTSSVGKEKQYIIQHQMICTFLVFGSKILGQLFQDCVWWYILVYTMQPRD